MMKTTVIVPTYNERENILRLISMLLAIPSDLEVMVVDDNSPDGTGNMVREMATNEPRILVIHRPAKLGLGSAYITGFKMATSLDVELIFTMDADFSHDPSYIPLMMERSLGADLVIGSRYVTGGTMNSPFSRRLISSTANALTHIMLELAARDSTGGFRCYRREVIDSIDLHTIFSSGYSFQIEMLYRIQRGGWRVLEIPIRFTDRCAGKSKIARSEISKALYTVFRLSLMRGFR